MENTPLKTNMKPEDIPLEKEQHLQTTIFLGFHVCFRGYISTGDFFLLGFDISHQVIAGFLKHQQ